MIGGHLPAAADALQSVQGAKERRHRTAGRSWQTVYELIGYRAILEVSSFNDETFQLTVPKTKVLDRLERIVPLDADSEGCFRE